MADIDSWVEAQEFQITLDSDGKIIDYLDNDIKRPNIPEERIRQKMVQRSGFALSICKHIYVIFPCQITKAFRLSYVAKL